MIRIGKEPKRHIDWSKVKEWIEGNWPPDDHFRPKDIEDMAIGMAGEIDKLVQDKLNGLIAEIESRAEATTLCDHIGDDQEALIIKNNDFDEIKEKHTR